MSEPPPWGSSLVCVSFGYRTSLRAPPPYVGRSGPAVLDIRGAIGEAQSRLISATPWEWGPAARRDGLSPGARSPAVTLRH
ncbi:hypothetical protein GCM10009530_34900 [Microbispora corallina]|uniref:Uncharacterized protein n=1 Tax=Microbispora corallina TaxID=83302 RepID=A0ABQ4FYS1_9ACTN|nr:hypothetical protein Mco01_29740 [Microbispora corallina]